MRPFPMSRTPEDRSTLAPIPVKRVASQPTPPQKPEPSDSKSESKGQAVAKAQSAASAKIKAS